jgi:hypothetical protein
MATLEQKMQAERDALEMLERHGLPEPDEVEYGFTCIWLRWREPKLALVVQIDPPPDDEDADDEDWDPPAEAPAAA